MATIKSLYSSAALLLVITAMAAQTMIVQSQQDCATTLTTLNTCGPYVVPGQSNMLPSPECCSALQNVDHGCLCNTLRIASRIPAACSLPALTCG
ncbi:Stamen-specific protein fil1 [Thalictrum thalictroides]|uniref:Stamen-specific protein fil1 n=1 Tax=Thalictrum thalictroides TaxID=46969 RepID=A0A7J6W9P1_THATH|nr:Stamen-specific protein fil1 [Thalictrum thalictroides]